MQIRFLGAAREVTGSCFLVETGRVRFLVDCGMHQGGRESGPRNRAFPAFDPSGVDFALLTHAHLDHTGYVPVLARSGFRGPVYATPATCDLAGILLPDSGHLQEEDARYANFKGYSKHRPALPLYTEEELRWLEGNARFLHEYTDWSVHGGFLRGALGRTALFAGHTISDWLCILVTEPDYAGAILRATAERAVENLELYLQAVGDRIDTILVSGADFGTQNGELFDPALFAQLHAPNYRLINDYVHAHSRAKTMFHCCGSIWNLIEQFIACGVDILNPVHTNTRNMQPQQLVARYGGRIVFWGGGVETQTVLPNGTVEDVRNQVRERIGVFGPGGGFVFAAVHNIQHGVPPRNVEAAVQAVLDYGRYPIGEGQGG